MAGSVIVETLEWVRVITLSNPAKRNAIDAGMLAQLADAFRVDPAVRALVVQGAGSGLFSAGWDLSDLSTYGPDEPLPDTRLSTVFDVLSTNPAPSVAIIDGPAFGAACELAMACDFRVGGPAAVLSMPPARLGLVYALEGLQRFRERIGPQATRALMLTGQRFDAAHGLRLGLLDSLDDDARRAGLELAKVLAGHAPLAVAGLKQGLELLARGGGSASARADYEMLRRESFNSADAAEGRRAILEKRSPSFRGE